MARVVNRPNQALELTATRRAFTFQMTKTVLVKATLALGGGSSALSSLDTFLRAEFRVTTLLMRLRLGRLRRRDGAELAVADFSAGIGDVHSCA